MPYTYISLYAFICLHMPPYAFIVCAFQVSISIGVAEELDDKLRRFSARAESGSLTLRLSTLHLEDSCIVPWSILTSCQPWPLSTHSADDLIKYLQSRLVNQRQVFGLRDCRTSVKLALGEARGSCNKTNCAALKGACNHFNALQCVFFKCFFTFPHFAWTWGQCCGSDNLKAHVQLELLRAAASGQQCRFYEAKSRNINRQQQTLSKDCLTRR